MRTLFVVLVFSSGLWSESPPKSSPPRAVPVPAADRAELDCAMARLDSLTAGWKGNPLLPRNIVLSGFYDEDWRM
jgi:hypothetical protein